MIAFATATGLLVLGASGCVSGDNAVPNPTPAGPGLDSGQPPFTTDGSVTVDSGPADAGSDTAVPPVDAGPDAAPRFTSFTGVGSGVVAHSQHFTVITKTGDEPGGAGVKSSKSFTVVSGVGK
jgi:hypothetical protein